MENREETLRLRLNEEMAVITRNLLYPNPRPSKYIPYSSVKEEYKKQQLRVYRALMLVRNNLSKLLQETNNG